MKRTILFAMASLLVGGTGCGGCVDNGSHKSGEGTTQSQESPATEATQAPVNKRLNIRSGSPLFKLVDGGVHLGAAPDAGAPSEPAKPQ